MIRTTILAFCTILLAQTPARALDLTVTHFGEGMYGVPFAVAREKGYFREAGLDVTGFITSSGGGTTVRNAMAAEIPYGEVALPAAIAAVQQGLALTIVHGGTNSVADLVWLKRKGDTSINSIADFKGRILGYSSPKSVTDMLSTIMLDQAGLTGQVERRAVGGVGPALTALREKAVDVVYSNEPIWSRDFEKYGLVLNAAQAIPHVTQTVGVVRTDYLLKNPDTIRKIIIARQRGVAFIRTNPAESATILAKAYKLDPAVAKRAIDTMLATSDQYWSEGAFDYPGLETMLKGLLLVQAIEPGPFDWSKVLDEAYLPEALRRPKS